MFIQFLDKWLTVSFLSAQCCFLVKQAIFKMRTICEMGKSEILRQVARLPWTELIPGARTTTPSMHKSVEIYKPGRTRGEVLVSKPDWGFTSYTTPDGSKALVLEQT